MYWGVFTVILVSPWPLKVLTNMHKFSIIFCAVLLIKIHCPEFNSPYINRKRKPPLTSDGFLFLMRHRGFGLRSASVRAEQTSPGRLAPRPTTLSGVRTLRCLALKNASLRETFFNETSGIRTPDNLIKSQVLYHLS